MKNRSMFSFFLSLLLVTTMFTTTSQAVVILSNNGSPGDSFVNLSGVNQGQAVGVTGWVYNNVRAGGEVGISTAYPNNGNGSAFLGGPNNAKADIEFLGTPVNLLGNYYPSTSLGKLSDLQALSYDWFRDSSSTVAGHFHPSLRILIDADGDLNTLDRGGLVYEGIYNGQAVAPLDQWVTVDVFSTDANLWSFGLGIANNLNGYDVNLSEWKNGITSGFASLVTGNAVVIGFSSGIGSGWAGTYEGAVDNISWKFDGQSAVTANFEVMETTTPVPEVGTVASASALGLLVFGSVIARRKKVQAQA